MEVEADGTEKINEEPWNQLAATIKTKGRKNFPPREDQIVLVICEKQKMLVAVL